MYRKTITEQLKLEMPFGVMLDANNRWVKLSAIMPWEKIESCYEKNFTGEKGQVAKSARLAFGALYIQGRLKITDDETVSQIQENPSMQFFCGFEAYTTEKPFDSSLMVHFRKRLTVEMMAEISEEAFKKEAKKAIELEAKKAGEQADNDSDKIDNTGNDNDESNNGDENGNNSDDDNPEEEQKPKGTLLIDATCCPSDIHYPTDINLLNHARELTEEIIDILHETNKQPGDEKPRTYRDVARRAFLTYAKKRSHTAKEIRVTLRGQLSYVRRNLDTIGCMVDEKGYSLGILPDDLSGKLIVVSEVYRQQKLMYDEKENRIDDRIVSISQPHLRPIVRGKAGIPVEFGAKVATARIGGFTFVIHMAYDNFREAKYLEKSAEKFKEMFGFYPEVIIGDKAYATNDNRKFCKSKGIRLSAAKRGRKSEEAKKCERKQLYEDGCRRNAVESDYGVTKRKYGLGLVMTKLYSTTLTTIAVAFFIKNMERVLRLLVLLFVSIKWNMLESKSALA